MVVAIVVIFGATYQFNDAFRAWGKNYFGDYTSCLLETGELPAIGGTGGTASACSNVFKPFNLADGRPAATTIGQNGAGGGGSGSGSNGSGGGSAGEDDGNNRGNSSGAGEGGGGASYAGSRRGSGSGFGNGNRFGGGAGRGGAGGAGQGARKTYTGSTEDSLAGSLSSGGRSSRSSRQRGLEGGYYLARDVRPDEQIDRTPAKVSEGSRREKTTRMLVKQRAKAVDRAEADTPMTFGDYLRYLLIAAIIIALIIVVGGQMAQVSADD